MYGLMSTDDKKNIKSNSDKISEIQTELSGINTLVDEIIKNSN